MNIPFPTPIPFVETLGFELHEWDAGLARISVLLRDEFCNSWSVAHGGLTMTLLDVVMAHAARSPNQPDAPTSNGVVTIEMKTSFMRAGLGCLMAQGRVLTRTASMAFCEGSVHDDSGQLVAHATGTFKYMKGLPAGGRRIQRLNASD